MRYRFTDTSIADRSHAADAAGQLQRTAGPEQLLLRQSRSRSRIRPPAIRFPATSFRQAQLSPNGLGILNAFRLPNLATPINGNQNWYLALNHPQHQRKDTLAVDFNLTDKQRLQFRRNNYAFWEYQPLDGGTDETPKFFNRPNQTNSLTTSGPSAPNKVNEFLATVSLDDVYIPVDQANFLDRTTRRASTIRTSSRRAS